LFDTSVAQHARLEVDPNPDDVHAANPSPPRRALRVGASRRLTIFADAVISPVIAASDSMGPRSIHPAAR
jgi:hypothetical protein